MASRVHDISALSIALLIMFSSFAFLVPLFNNPIAPLNLTHHNFNNQSASSYHLFELDSLVHKCPFLRVHGGDGIVGVGTKHRNWYGGSRSPPHHIHGVESYLFTPGVWSTPLQCHAFPFTTYKRKHDPDVLFSLINCIRCSCLCFTVYYLIYSFGISN